MDIHQFSIHNLWLPLDYPCDPEGGEGEGCKMSIVFVELSYLSVAPGQRWVTPESIKDKF